MPLLGGSPKTGRVARPASCAEMRTLRRCGHACCSNSLIRVASRQAASRAASGCRPRPRLAAPSSPASSVTACAGSSPQQVDRVIGQHRRGQVHPDTLPIAVVRRQPLSLALEAPDSHWAAIPRVNSVCVASRVPFRSCPASCARGQLTTTVPTAVLSASMARAGRSSKHNEVAGARRLHGRKRHCLVESDESPAMMRR